MTLLEHEFGYTLMKFCSNLDYCKDIADGNIYMKENGFFRKLDDTYRGDRFDGRVLVTWKGDTVPIKLSNDEIVDTVFVEDIEYGLKNSDKIPLFCTTMLDEAIVDIDDTGKCTFYNEFIEEISKFGKYVVCFSLEEFLLKAQVCAYQNGFAGHYSKVHYFDTESVYSSVYGEYRGHCDMRHAFPFALFKKDISYCWQNEWRFALLTDGNTIIPPEKDHHIMTLDPVESAKIYKIDDIFDARIAL